MTIRGNVGEVVVVPSEMGYSVWQAAKILNVGLGERKLYQFLRDHQIIDSSEELRCRNRPLSEYEEKGYIKGVWREYGLKTIQNHGWQVLISESGIEFIRKLIKNH